MHQLSILPAAALPRTRFVDEGEVLGYQIAPLDFISYWNGIYKYPCTYNVFTVAEFEFCVGYLRYLFPLLPHELATDQVVVAQILEHEDKTSGYPFNSEFGCPLKGQALHKLGLPFIRQLYSQYASVVGSTLKDELRLKGKDSRLFRPQCVASYVEGCTLFYHQNEYLMKTLFMSPLFVKFATPGTDITYLYHLLQHFGGDCYAADGSQWDAHFALFCAVVICAFRSDDCTFERIQEYYCQMYNGWTNVQGNAVNLTGQPSGHFNTTVDNSLGHCVMFALHAYRHSLRYSQIEENVLFFTCGDDLIWSDRSGLFTPVRIEKTYNSMGMYLEFESYEPKQATELSFVGVTYKERIYQGVVYPLYIYKVDKMCASFKFTCRDYCGLDRLAKMSSLTQNVFADEQVYRKLYVATHEYAEQLVRDDLVVVGDPAFRGILAAIEEHALFTLYTKLES